MKLLLWKLLITRGTMHALASFGKVILLTWFLYFPTHFKKNAPHSECASNLFGILPWLKSIIIGELWRLSWTTVYYVCLCTTLCDTNDRIFISYHAFLIGFVHLLNAFAVVFIDYLQSRSQVLNVFFSVFCPLSFLIDIKVTINHFLIKLLSFSALTLLVGSFDP